MTNVFDDQSSDKNQIDSTVELLKARYQKEDGSVDMDGVWKKMAHADKHITTLEDELANERSNSKVGNRLEEILAKIEAKSNARDEHRPESETAGRTQTSEVNFDKIVEERLNAYEARKTAERNAEAVRQELIKLWGPQYVDTLRARTRELGETEDYMGRLAIERPQLFLNLVKGTKAINDSPYNAPASSHRMPGSQVKTGPKTYADFEKIRKENPKLYKSKAIQDQMFKLAKEAAQRGESFTDN